MSGLAVWMSPILSVTFPAPGHCVTCFNHRTRPVGNPNGSPAHAKKQELHLWERAYLKNIPRISYKSEVDMAEEFINNEHQLQKPQKVMINSIVSTAAVSQKDEKNEDLKEINGKDEAEASGDGLIDLPTIISTTSMETVSVEPSNDDDITMHQNTVHPMPAPSRNKHPFANSHRKSKFVKKPRLQCTSGKSMLESPYTTVTVSKVHESSPSNQGRMDIRIHLSAFSNLPACEIYLFTYVHFNTGTIAEDEFQMTNEQQSNCDEHSKCQGDAEAHEQQQ
ncbi:hypothetical protein D917_02230 [Trichinella nativa]|uniref:Uncharacterized protein n=1 Tax=Trichinella nativa TaxID=6335 RepID=A0A1Y3EGM2_9BILA|nr:hypothetical protein D917_02230 [Trichinella nativa]